MKVSERQIRNIVRESIRRSLKSKLNEWRWDDPAEHDRQKAIWARQGYEMIDREDDEPIFVDSEGNEFVLDDYGHRLVPVENNFGNDEFMMEEVDMGQVPSAQDSSDRANSRIWNDLQLENNPVYKKLKAEVNRLRVGYDEAEARGEDMEAYTEKIRALNRRINGIIDAVKRKGVSPVNLQEGVEDYDLGQVGQFVINFLEKMDKLGQLNRYFVNDSERDWRYLTLDIISNALKVAGGTEVVKLANTVYDKYVSPWKGKSKFRNITNMHSLEENAKRLNERGDLPDDYEEDENGLPKDLNQQIDKANAFYAKDLEEDTKYTEFTNYNVDASETLGYVNQAFDTLDRMMKRMFERSDIFGENLGNMAFKTARELRSMKERLNTEFTKSQSQKVNRRLRPRK